MAASLPAPDMQAHAEQVARIAVLRRELSGTVVRREGRSPLPRDPEAAKAALSMLQAKVDLHRSSE